VLLQVQVLLHPAVLLLLLHWVLVLWVTRWI
jgi:hypothetical protein